MIEKKENCKYCGAKMESKTAKKLFCCDTHRTYWHRENKKVGTSQIETHSETEILREIIKIEREVIPKERDTPIGRITWQNEKNVKINQLKSKIK